MWKSLGMWLLRTVIEQVVKDMGEKTKVKSANGKS